MVSLEGHWLLISTLQLQARSSQSQG